MVSRCDAGARLPSGTEALLYFPSLFLERRPGAVGACRERAAPCAGPGSAALRSAPLCSAAGVPGAPALPRVLLEFRDWVIKWSGNACCQLCSLLRYERGCECGFFFFRVLFFYLFLFLFFLYLMLFSAC